MNNVNKIIKKLKKDDNFCFLSESPDTESKYVILQATENMELYGYLFDYRSIECNCIKKSNDVYMLHRTDGPAIIVKNQTYLPDFLYDVINEDTIIPIKKCDEETKYYIDGINYSEQQFWNI